MNQPRALFDTLDFLYEEMPICVQKYLDAIGIDESLEEYKLTVEFLKSYSGSPDTYTSYRREVERLMHWSWLVMKKPIKDLNRNDMRDYLKFASDPPLSWIGTKNHRRFVWANDAERAFNEHWRPFTMRISKSKHRQGETPDKTNYKMSNSSIQALFAGLSTFYCFLQQEEYVEVNPVALIRQKNRYLQKQQQRKVTRKLSDTQWHYVIEHTQKIAGGDPDNERSLFMMAAFYLLGLRISELAETPGRIPQMGDFAPDKQGLWWFTTVSKGNKIRDVAVPDTMMEILKRYRRSLGLSSLPAREENTPLLHKQRGKGGLGTRQVRNLVQQCFDNAIAKLRRDGNEDEAQDLETATVHWLRHTSITADIAHRPREHVRDDVGHENPATMDKYIDIDRMARHASAQDKVLKPENET